MFKLPLNAALCAMAIATVAPAHADLYRYKGNMPMAKVMLDMMEALGYIQRVPDVYGGGAWGSPWSSSLPLALWGLPSIYGLSGLPWGSGLGGLSGLPGISGLSGLSGIPWGTGLSGLPGLTNPTALTWPYAPGATNPAQWMNNPYNPAATWSYPGTAGAYPQGNLPAPTAQARRSEDKAPREDKIEISMKDLQALIETARRSNPPVILNTPTMVAPGAPAMAAPQATQPAPATAPEVPHASMAAPEPTAGTHSTHNPPPTSIMPPPAPNAPTATARPIDSLDGLWKGANNDLLNVDGMYFTWTDPNGQTTSGTFMLQGDLLFARTPFSDQPVVYRVTPIEDGFVATNEQANYRYEFKRVR